MNKKPIQFRQGDVLLEKIENIPASALKAKTKVVAEGEGHHEHIVDENVDIMIYGEEKYLAVNADVKLEHVIKGTRNKAEHHAISLAPGNYRVIQQREYDPYEDAVMELLD